ncbi:hypothetical protein [Nocardioides jiangxiensis]|uniref:Peptidase MA superfamily protein n=1 Tax=Nocardioides jiangxiensis TaxID=3064524 RepID=A0ABT9B8L7_9ACTN|nr:hypothetical protein [Nocardioides sp. WY-20]MDO7869493.1 hypothetical protein [Nocardioides sp. WY-20]
MRRGIQRLAPLLLGALLAAGCSAPPPATSPAPTPAGPPLEEAVSTVLAARSKAVLMHDQPAFMEGVDPEKPGFRRNQLRLFANLQELPLAAYDVQLRGVTELPGGAVQAEVTVITQLDGYDVVPVRTPGLFTFRRTDEGTLELDADHDAGYDADHDVDLQPWERTRIEAEDRDGVLGIFDRASIDDAYQVMRAVRRGIDDIAPLIPLPWSHHVVVYALSDVAQMASLDDLPGGDPERLEGVAFSVPAGDGNQDVASVRFMLHPRVLGRDDARRDRLIRHELTHVAVADRDDRVPTWLAEGIAEWVSVQAVPRHERVISREALEMAQAGLTALPRDADFNDEHTAANYGIAWWACQVVADRFGPDTVWQLLAEMGKGGGTSEADQDGVLRRVLGMSGAELAAAAGRRIVRTFG